jgi:hypothetical protein
VTGPVGWPPLRRRPPRLAKHRAHPTTTETDMPPQPAASLPLHITEPAPPPAPPEPDEIVRCGYCQAIGPSSLIPDVPTRGPRCADTDACTKRWYEGKPVSLVPHAAEALTPLPEPEAAADAAEHAATQALARWAPGETLAGASEPDPADETTERNIAITRADALAPSIAAIEEEVLPVAAENDTPDGGDAE